MPRAFVLAIKIDNSYPLRESSNNFEGFLFIFALSSNVPTNSDTWSFDSGASRHITGLKEHLFNLKENDSHLQVIIGDDASYLVKSVGSTSFKLDSSIPLHLSDVLYVSSIKKSDFYISFRREAIMLPLLML